MSGFAALLNFAHPPDGSRVSAVAAAIARRGADRQGRQESGSCTLLHAARVTTPEARLERQPQRHVLRDWWLTGDVRIDNRDELRRLLRPQAHHPLVTDADLVLAAYEAWGLDCPGHLIGDFGFVLWDLERQRLLAARDHVGVRPVVLSRTPGGLVIGSSVAGILAGLNATPPPDEDYLAGYLAGLPPPNRTMWTGVSRLPAGHLLVADQRGVAIERWWRPTLDPILQSGQDTVEQVRTVLDEAVACRLRSADGVGADVSGGLDSSTVAAIATHLGTRPLAVALAFRDNREADETAHQGTVAEYLGLRLDVLDADHLDALDPVEFAARHREAMCATGAADTAAIYAWCRAQGASVSLSGLGGDEAFYGEDSHLVDLAMSGRAWAAVRAADWNGSGAGAAAAWIARQVARDRTVALAGRAGAALPGGGLVRTVARAREARFRRAFPWLATPPPALATWSARPRGAPRAAYDRSRYYVDAVWGPAGYELNDLVASDRGVEVRYPFLDRRLVELVLRLPESQVRWGGKARGLHRRVVGDRLPASVVSRRDKADLSRPFMRKVLVAVDRDRAVELLAALGDRVDPRPLLETYDAGSEAFDRPLGTPRGFDLWAALSAGAALLTV